MSRPGWFTLALAATGGVLVGVLLVVALAVLADDGETQPSKTRTVIRTVVEQPPAEPVVPSDRDLPDQVITLPDLVGTRLDRANDELAAIDVSSDVVDGGGAFGVLDESNWVVVSQNPEPGSPVEPGSTVEFAIERG